MFNHRIESNRIVRLCCYLSYGLIDRSYNRSTMKTRSKGKARLRPQNFEVCTYGLISCIHHAQTWCHQGYTTERTTRIGVHRLPRVFISEIDVCRKDKIPLRRSRCIIKHRNTIRNAINNKSRGYTTHDYCISMSSEGYRIAIIPEQRNNSNNNNNINIIINHRVEQDWYAQ